MRIVQRLFTFTIALALVSCANVPSTTIVVNIPTTVPKPAIAPTPTEEVVNSALIDAYKTAFADPKKVLSETQLGTEIYPSYLEKHTSDKSVLIPGTTTSFSSQTVNAIVKSIDEYAQLVEDTIGKKPSNFIVSWNKKQGDQFAFAICGTEEVNGKEVMFWAADIDKAGTPDHPVLSFNPMPANFGVSSTRNIKLIQIELPPNAPISNLHVRWWTNKADTELQRIPVFVITVSKLEFYLFDVLKSQQEGIEKGWISELRPEQATLPDLGNNTWKILANLNNAIGIINADGSTTLISNVRRNQLNMSQAIWSPDGNRIAFSVNWFDNNYKDEIFITNADGTHPFQLTHMRAESIWNLAWSPDGKRIAFVAGTKPKEPDQLYVINTNGSGLTQLTKLSDGLDAWLAAPVSWTSDSKGIMYQASRQRWLITLDGSAPTQLPSLFLYEGCWWPVFSPDGKKIAFMCLRRQGDSQIWVANADGSEKVQLTNVPDTGNVLPAWSPDGKFIAFCTNRYGNWELWVMKADGSEQVLLKSGPYGEPQWRP